MHQVKVQQEKLKAVKARLNFEELSQHSKSGTLSRTRDVRKRLGSKRIRSMSGSLETRRGRSESPRKRDPERKTVFKRLEKGVFHMLGDKDKDPVEIHHIKQREGESTEEFVRRFKIESRDMKGAPEVMRISGFMHRITNPELIKLLHDKIPRSVDEMMRVTMSFLGGRGIVILKSSKIIPIECAAVSGPEGQPPAINQTIKERIKVAINPEYPEQTIMIGSTLMEEGQNKLCNLLRRNLDVFAWTPTDMTGVPRHIAEHRLNVREGCPLVRQKKRGQEADRNQAIQEEVEKLVDARIMKEVHYYNFKDLNKACSKDGYPLPEIDWKVESLCRFPFKCFLDAYNGYDQLKLAKEDEEKIVFITSQGTFCYSKMPFGLRNAGATNQRLVDKAFHKQIGRNLEVYVDDLVIKISMEDEIVRDIEETFKTLREINMKLNLKKSAYSKTPHAHCTGKKEELIVYLAAAKEVRPRVSVKGKILADFIVERPKEESSDTPIEAEKEFPEPWILFTDGSCVDGSRAGLILTDPEGAEVTYALRFRVEATNNETEYEALIAGLG
ncbi:reverse transcriptase domain-containing protein [Tanacetum coccineum]